MTELELQRAKRNFSQMTRASRWERFCKWLRALCARESQADNRRARLERKAEVERKAREAL